MNEQAAAEGQRSRAGRPLKSVDADEPGATYVSALRRWRQIAGINSAELAKRLGISEGALSRTLNNRRNWKASQELLPRALEIIKICGGTKTDQKNWETYHEKVSTYQAIGGAVPTPPEPEQASLAVREYVVEKHGAVLDADGRVVGEIIPGDVVLVRSLDTGPYHARYEATVSVDGTDVVGWVNQAGLQYRRTITSAEPEPPSAESFGQRPRQMLAVREYVVKKHGAVLDRDRRTIGRVVPGDVVRVQSLDTGPYHARYEATVTIDGTEIVGWINQAALQYQRTITSTGLERRA